MAYLLLSSSDFAFSSSSAFSSVASCGIIPDKSTIDGRHIPTIKKAVIKTVVSIYALLLK